MHGCSPREANLKQPSATSTPSARDSGLASAHDQPPGLHRDRVCHMALFTDPDGNDLMLHNRYAAYD